IHAHLANNRCKAAVYNKGGLCLYGPAQAISITNGQNGHPCLSQGMAYGTVTDGHSPFYIFYLIYPGFKLHRGNTVSTPYGRRLYPQKKGRDTDIIVVALGIYRREK